mmetsp:Transcript_5278/g.17450  ORF Transcript_5278/g.17450 Transcript_5278/m.17450 type:complete len:201 (-) Transcript_5278:396-998(-)
MQKMSRLTVYPAFTPHSVLSIVVKRPAVKLEPGYLEMTLAAASAACLLRLVAFWSSDGRSAAKVFAAEPSISCAPVVTSAVIAAAEASARTATSSERRPLAMPEMMSEGTSEGSKASNWAAPGVKYRVQASGGGYSSAKTHREGTELYHAVCSKEPTGEPKSLKKWPSLLVAGSEESPSLISTRSSVLLRQSMAASRSQS